MEVAKEKDRNVIRITEDYQKIVGRLSEDYQKIVRRLVQKIYPPYMQMETNQQSALDELYTKMEAGSLTEEKIEELTQQAIVDSF
ncbi:MAG: hypothetical protein LBD75_05565 [Candidatus Peribacteria bacterium]|nr:hypothetical protein [Candidatus Peribacteria bacterium]